MDLYKEGQSVKTLFLLQHGTNSCNGDPKQDDKGRTPVMETLSKTTRITTSTMEFLLVSSARQQGQILEGRPRAESFRKENVTHSNCYVGEHDI
jgi:hypothetical protein